LNGSGRERPVGALIIERGQLQGFKVFLDHSPWKAAPGLFNLALKRHSPVVQAVCLTISQRLSLAN
jgi:hypothetical protein